MQTEKTEHEIEILYTEQRILSLEYEIARNESESKIAKKNLELCREKLKNFDDTYRKKYIEPFISVQEWTP